MELYQLENFIAVVEEHSFTRAAERLFRTQAAVSVAIRKLEDEVGIPLVTRDSHECAVTEAGHVVLLHARRMVEARNEMVQCLAEFTCLGTGRVRIAAHESAAQYLLMQPLSAFYATYPEIKIVTRLCDVQEISQLVSDREVDLGFGIRQVSLHGLRSELILTDPLVLVTSPHHRLTRVPSVHIEDLSDERFFVHHLHTLTTDTIEQLFAQHHSKFDVAAELWNFETVKQFVRAGNGAAILPLSVVRPDLDAGGLVVIPVVDLEITRSIDVVYRDEGQLLPAPAALLAILRKCDRERASRVTAPFPHRSVHVITEESRDAGQRRTARAKARNGRKG